MPSPSPSPRLSKPTKSTKTNKPKRMKTFTDLNSEFPMNEELPIKRNYSSNSNSPLSYNTARVAGPRPVRIEGTNKFTSGRIRNKKKTRDKRRKSGKKTKRKKRSN